MQFAGCHLLRLDDCLLGGSLDLDSLGAQGLGVLFEFPVLQEIADYQPQEC